MKTTKKAYVAPEVEVVAMETGDVFMQYSNAISDKGVSELDDFNGPQSNKNVWTDMW